MSEWIVTAGSLGVVLLMIGIAAALGFRHSTRLDEAHVARLAAAEGAGADAVVVAADGRSAFARLSNGKLMVARVMGDDVSARVAPASAVRVRLEGGKLSVRFGDLGYPPLHMHLQTAPTWLAELAAGDAQ